MIAHKVNWMVTLFGQARGFSASCVLQGGLPIVGLERCSDWMSNLD